MPTVHVAYIKIGLKLSLRRSNCHPDPSTKLHQLIACSLFLNLCLTALGLLMQLLEQV